MGKIFKILLLCIFILCGCSKNSSELSLPTNKETTPMADFTATPYPTITSTPRAIRWANELIQFNDMAIISDDEIWAVGQNGLIIHDYLTFGALRGEFDYSGEYNFTSGYLDDVEFTSPDDGWMLSWCGQVFHWDGESWSEARPTNLPYFLECTIYFSDISFASKDDGWLIGAEGASKSDSHRAILYHWDGTDWKELSLLNEVGRDNFSLVDVEVISTQEVWVVGNNNSDYQGVILFWNGKIWKELSTIENMDRLQSISATGPNDVWTTNGANIFRWDGNVWKIASQLQAHRVRSDFSDITIKAVNPENIWFGGYDQLVNWNGKTWQDVKDDGVLDIVDIEVSSDGKVWALTRSGTIFRLVR